MSSQTSELPYEELKRTAIGHPQSTRFEGEKREREDDKLIFNSMAISVEEIFFHLDIYGHSETSEKLKQEKRKGNKKVDNFPKAVALQTRRMLSGWRRERESETWR